MKNSKKSMLERLRGSVKRYDDPTKPVEGAWDSFFNSPNQVSEDFCLSEEDKEWLNQKPVGNEEI